MKFFGYNFSDVRSWHMNKPTNAMNICYTTAYVDKNNTKQFTTAANVDKNNTKQCTTAATIDINNTKQRTTTANID